MRGIKFTTPCVGGVLPLKGTGTHGLSLRCVLLWTIAVGMVLVIWFGLVWFYLIWFDLNLRENNWKRYCQSYLRWEHRIFRREVASGVRLNVILSVFTICWMSTYCVRMLLSPRDVLVITLRLVIYKVLAHHICTFSFLSTFSLNLHLI